MATIVHVGVPEVEQWIEKYLRKRYPELEPEYRAGWDGLRRTLQSGSLSPSDLGAVVNAARSTYAALWENGTGWLAVLSHGHPAAQDEVRRMASDRAAHVRFNALCCIGLRTPKDLASAVVLPAIDDKSSRVRWKAAEKANRIRLRDAVPLLERRRGVESNPTVIRSLDHVLPLLRHDHTVEAADGGVLLTVWAAGGTRSEIVSDREVRRRGVPAIVAEWRRALDDQVMRVEYVP